MKLTKKQYDLLKDFDQLAKKSSNEDEILKNSKSELLELHELSKLLEKHKGLNPSYQFSKEEFEGTFLEQEYLNIYLNNIGLENCIKCDEGSSYYYLTANGDDSALTSMSEYEKDQKSICIAEEANKIANDANKRSKIANWISFIAILVSILSFVIGK